MDPARLDTLARTLATTPRRRVLKFAATSALLALLGRSRAAAHHKPKHCAALGKHCGANKGCCDADATCQGGTCHRCTAEEATCTDDAGCCGGVCCRDELIDPVGTCCASQDQCCGSHCCTTGQACDFRFLMCVACTAEGETCVNPVPFCVCCAGLDLTCEGEDCKCVPKPGTARRQ